MAKQNSSRHRAMGGTDEPVVGLRIIGGSLRGRKLGYSGDFRTRPMKDRVREAVFNLLGPQVAGSQAIDLFAGTGALGIEAISRGATKATFIERHLPTAELIKANAAALGIADRIHVVFGDAFRWSADFKVDGVQPLTVFCSPPYDFYVERKQAMLELIGRWVELGAAGTQIVVEADERFEMGLLPRAGEWDVRTYPPAVVGIMWKDEG
jgi:16S rRNA (guanine966-N2)-methyltransferase